MPNFARVYQRWDSAYLILADSTEDVADAQAAFPDAPIGSKIIAAGDGALPTEYLMFPAGWKQVSNFAEGGE